jgi:hypothetical protein
MQTIPTHSTNAFIVAVDRLLAGNGGNRQSVGIAGDIQQAWAAAGADKSLILNGLDHLLTRGPAAVRGVVFEAMSTTNSSGHALLADWVRKAPTWLADGNPRMQGEPLGVTLVRTILPGLRQQPPALAPHVWALVATYGGQEEWAMHWASRDASGRGITELRRWAHQGGFPGKSARRLGLIYSSSESSSLEEVAVLTARGTDAQVDAFYRRATKRMNVDERRELMGWLRPDRAVLSEEASALDLRVQTHLAETMPTAGRALHDLFAQVNRRLPYVFWGGLPRLEAVVPGMRWVWERLADTSVIWLEGDDPVLQRLALALTVVAPAPSLRQHARAMVRQGRHVADALAALLSLGDVQSAGLYRKYLHSDDEQKRQIAWLGLTRLGSEIDLNWVLDYPLDCSRDAAVCNLILLGLGGRPEPRAGDRLLSELVSTPSYATWFAVRQALWEQGDVLLEPLMQLADGDDVSISGRAIEAMALCPAWTAQKRLMQAIHEPAMLFSAAEALMHRGDSRGRSEMLKIIAFEQGERYDEAATRLASTGDPTGLRLWLPLAFRPERAEMFRRGLLAVMTDHRPAVRQLLDDPDPRVQEAARLVSAG